MQKITILIIGIFITSSVFSQTASPELVSSAGDSYNNSSFQLDWSIGECVTETHNGGAYVITQGFHQNTYVVSKVEDLLPEINITVFPNPTSDFITVLWENFPSSAEHGKVLTITNLNGKEILQEIINNKEKQLDLSTYTKGVYFLTIKQENKLIKSFKIIKN